MDHLSEGVPQICGKHFTVAGSLRQKSVSVRLSDESEAGRVNNAEKEDSSSSGRALFVGEILFPPHGSDLRVVECWVFGQGGANRRKISLKGGLGNHTVRSAH